MKPPQTPETSLIATDDRLALAQTNAFRVRTAVWRQNEADKNQKFDDMALRVATHMTEVVVSEKPEVTLENKIGAAKAFADIVKSHKSLQENTIKIAEMDLVPDIPKPNQTRPPMMPTMIDNRGGTVNLAPPPEPK